MAYPLCTVLWLLDWCPSSWFSAPSPTTSLKRWFNAKSTAFLACPTELVNWVMCWTITSCWAPYGSGWVSTYDINIELQIPSPRERTNRLVGMKGEMPFFLPSSSTRELSIVCYVTPGKKPRPCGDKVLHCCAWKWDLETSSPILKSSIVKSWLLSGIAIYLHFISCHLSILIT